MRHFDEGVNSADAAFLLHMCQHYWDEQRLPAAPNSGLPQLHPALVGEPIGEREVVGSVKERVNPTDN
jgi:hypothetical protein